jgi:formate/nitrite transporter FocA (FNT family)
MNWMNWLIANIIGAAAVAWVAIDQLIYGSDHDSMKQVRQVNHREFLEMLDED